MSTKRGRNEGAIRKRPDGRWEARYTAFDGERHSVYAKTRQEVARLLNEALRQREQGLGTLNERQTVGDYLTAWIERYKHHQRVSSYERYETVVRRHLVPELGRLALTKLTPQQVEQFYARLRDHGKSPVTVWFCHRVLNHALHDASRLGIVHRNIMELVKAPRVRPREMAVLTEEQAQTLLAAVAGDRLEAFIVLGLATGIREGELLALRWEDVDFGRSSLVVRANLMRTRKGVSREETKTSYSRRMIAIPSLALEALKRHRVRQAEERLQLGDAWQDKALVFANHFGGPYLAANLRVSWFYPLLLRAGLPRIRVHDLRHTAATLLLAHGVPVKVVSEMLGHANIGITLSLYAHVLPHMQQEAANTMDDVLRGTRGISGSTEQTASEAAEE